MFSVLKDALFSVTLPKECGSCGGPVDKAAGSPACSDCWASTKIFSGEEMLCIKCGAFFDDDAAAQPISCPFCEDQKYDRAIACGVYKNALAASVVSLKTTPKISNRLRSLIESAVVYRELSPFDLIIPIPLSAARRTERGFNQAEVIARIISKISSVPVDAGSLRRRRHTAIHRVGMDRRARELSVENAFEVTRPKLVKGCRALLVDDVLTSGSTASACAAVLKKTGAVRVEVFTLARAVID